MQPNELKVGQVFTYGNAKIFIHDVKECTIHYSMGSISHPRVYMPTDIFCLSIKHWTLETKPLDKAFKTLDKTYCKHTNIREDRFFSAMVYKTCKDCGKSLN